MNQIKQLTGQCIAEFFGTGLIIFFGCGCVAALQLLGVGYGQWEISIIWGIGVAMAIYLSAGVSGAHLNPVVTLVLCLFAKFSARRVLPYIIAQTTGAFCAAMLVYALYQSQFMHYEQMNHLTRGSVDSLVTAGIFATYPHTNVTVLNAFWVEFTITSLLIIIIMALVDDDNGIPRGPLAPLLIGFAIAVIGSSMGPLTGFAMNPARDFGPRLFASLAGWGEVAFTGACSTPYYLVPIFGPIFGGLVGGGIYLFFIARYLPNINNLSR